MLDIHWDPKKFYQTIHTYYKYIYIMHWVAMLISIHSIHSKSKYMSSLIISHQIIEENLISQQKKTATGTGSYKVQTYKTRTNLHLTNLNLLNSADKPTPTTNFKRWKYDISLGYKVKNDWKSEGSGPTKMDIGFFFTNFHIRLKNTPLQS